MRCVEERGFRAKEFVRQVQNRYFSGQSHSSSARVSVVAKATTYKDPPVFVRTPKPISESNGGAEAPPFQLAVVKLLATA
jgi:hypothetical protein